MVIKNYKNIHVQKFVAYFLLVPLVVVALKISYHQTQCTKNSAWESTFTLTS